MSAGDAICGWDNIKIETVMGPPDELAVTINSPQVRTYGTTDFPLTYEVELSHMGTVEYSLDGAPPVAMAPDEGGILLQCLAALGCQVSLSAAG